MAAPSSVHEIFVPAVWLNGASKSGPAKSRLIRAVTTRLARRQRLGHWALRLNRTLTIEQAISLIDAALKFNREGGTHKDFVLRFYLNCMEQAGLIQNKYARSHNGACNQNEGQP
jgi:hypothetical protein